MRNPFFNIKKNLSGIISLIFIILVALIAFFAYAIAPDNSKNANQMHLSIHSKAPGFEVDMLVIPNDIEPQSSINKLLYGDKNPDIEIPIINYKISNDTIYYQEFNQFDYKTLSLQLIDGSPIMHKKFYFGTDKFGRDVLSRIIIGARISFSIGFIAVFISLIIGLIMGCLSGYYSGFVDQIIMWLINVTWSIPTLLLVIAITLALGKGFWQVFIAVGLTMWVEVARVVRGQVISLKQREFITAARVLGFSDFRIITRHILPNITSSLIIICAANFAASILIESGLSFLGLGAQPPMSSWGSMIKDHYNYIILGEPFLAIAPGVCIMMLVMAFMLLGNSLRDVLDVNN